MWKIAKRFWHSEVASNAPFMALITGVVFLLVGLIVGPIVVGQAATAVTGIGSFAGATAMKDLIPFLYYVILVIVSVGMIGWGAWTQFKGKK